MGPQGDRCELAFGKGRGATWPEVRLRHHNDGVVGGGQIATEPADAYTTARTTVHHDAGHPSRLVLPIMID
jgi:hypothetical protein